MKKWNGYVVGDQIEITGGTHRGRSGTILRVTELTCWVQDYSGSEFRSFKSNVVVVDRVVVNQATEKVKGLVKLVPQVLMCCCGMGTLLEIR